MPIYINNWFNGGNLRNCGFRSNLYENSKLYCSPHLFGRAFDLHSSNNRKLYNDVIELHKTGKLKAIKRIESPLSTKYAWCHIDSLNTNTSQLEVFTN